MSDIKLLESCPIAKSDQNNLANRIILPVLEGDVSPVEAVVQAKSLIEVLTKFVNDDRIKDCTLSEIEKNGKEATWNGARITIKEVGTKYDYTDCNDPVYTKLLDQKKILDKQLKEREAFLKSLPNRTTVVDEETGEVTTVIPPVRMSCQGYTVTFPK